MPASEQDIPRIGRPETPMEHGLRLMREEPGYLDRLAFNLYESTVVGDVDLLPVETVGRQMRNAKALWEAMSEDERDTYRQQILAAQEEEIRDAD